MSELALSGNGARRSGRRHLKPGWPLIVIFAGVPLWWVLGLVQVMFFVMALPMLVYLLRERDVPVPRGLGAWLLFLIWLLGGLFVMQVDAPGAIAGESASRYLTFTYRFGWYVVGTISLLYVVSSRAFLSTQRIVQALSLMFLALLGGGLLGVTFPTLEFPSLIEAILPRSIASNDFVSSLIHPQVAQVHTFLGYAEARPSAPFSYTNEWGLSIAATLPFFIVAWWRRGGWQRAMVPVLAGIAIIPIISSMNRGLWVALIVMVAFAVVRVSLQGHLNMLALAVAGLVVAGGVIIFSPLGDLIEARLNAPHSNEGRANLSTLSVESALQGSPVMGFGTTRDVQGNFTSIAGGASDLCPACSPPALGTQGQLWLLVFGAGLVGALLFVTFFAGQLLRHMRDPSASSIAASCAVIACMVTMPVYNSVGPAIYICLIAVGIMHREGDRLNERRLIHLIVPATRNWQLVVACALVGAVSGGLIHSVVGAPYVVTQTLLVPRNVSLGSTDIRPLSMDSEALLATSGPVLEVIASVTGESDLADVAENLAVTAEPNSRILNLTLKHADANLVMAASTKAAHTFLDLRTELSTEAPGVMIGEGAEILRSTRPIRSADPAIVKVSSGLMLGFVAGLVVAWALDGRLDRLRRGPESRLGIDLPTVARVPVPQGEHDVTSSSLKGARRAVGTYSPLCAVLADQARPAAVQAADLLGVEATAGGPWSGTRVLLVASTRSRYRPVRELHRSCQDSGLDPVGLILVEE